MPAVAAPVIDDALLAPAVAAAAAASVGQLLRAVSTERSAMVHRGGPSIEDVVREELRPLLKDWLDQHLPAMVERLVRVEIERVVGRALS
jgi:cell pole-organizing protein PopZ